MTGEMGGGTSWVRATIPFLSTEEDEEDDWRARRVRSRGDGAPISLS